MLQGGYPGAPGYGQCCVESNTLGNHHAAGVNRITKPPYFLNKTDVARACVGAAFWRHRAACSRVLKAGAPLHPMLHLFAGSIVGRHLCARYQALPGIPCGLLEPAYACRKQKGSGVLECD